MKCSAVLTLLCAAPAALAQNYSVSAIDLDPGIVTSFATGVTNTGRVVGALTVESGRRTFGFVWRNGATEQLVVPQPGETAVRPRTLDIQHHVHVLAMTDGGYYSGVADTVDFGFNSQPYFAWLPSADPYPPQYFAAENLGSAFVFGIADSSPMVTGVGAGTALIGNFTVRQAFISLLSQADDVGSPARTMILPGFGGSTSAAAAFAVNSSGDVVGYAADSAGIHRPFLRRAADGVTTDLGTLGGPSGEALTISDSGYIAGQADIGPARPHAFVLAPDSVQLTDLGTLGGAVSAARSINNAGIAVGESWTSDGLVHAVLWRGGLMTDLNASIPANSGWVLVHATGINDSGMIVGSGLYGGRTLAFVLTPAQACYANCDNSTAPPILNINDFQCFLNSFAVGTRYANCDGSTAPPVLNANDFQCFLNAFAAGCQ